MKTLLSILLLVITFSCNAQYSQPKLSLTKDSPAMLVPIGITVVTAVTIDYMIRQKTYDSMQTSTIAVTGIVTSVISYKLIQVAKANTPRKIRRKRYKRLSRI